MVRALISGAGIAGAALAWQLAGRGVDVTVVEKSAGQRSSGNPVDVRGEALGLVDAMGGGDRLRAAATRVRWLVAVDRRGRRIAKLPASTAARGVESIEVPRAELVKILAEAASQRVRIVMDESISGIRPHADRVSVEFESGASDEFELVIGADGQHSRVRALAFGPERSFARRLGMFVATVESPEERLDPEEVTMLNVPGRSFTLHPSSGRPGAAFIFHSPAALEADRREWDRSVVADAYSGLAWRVPEFVERFMTAPDVYFDAVTKISLDSWSQGRVALLGDAASSVSLFGDGSTLALLGARTLADAIAEHPLDPAAAFARYEARHRALVMPKQRAVRSVSTLLVPRTALGLGVRNLALRGIQAFAALRPAAG
ncbi:NAD(P)-binding protein [Planctomonas sp. JC2975]|uniref:FAD-dependent oxidoreductase n=1 Tax=Planctomonas sp. JC2975 TaxID=2729626 RepID=UPI001475AF08|nr:FAD-dependent oxidoreductase [Planctomonas sp. JC2975]NNC13537.1 NAD(P)-binding protein [Planctomonas sp. JC2975]